MRMIAAVSVVVHVFPVLAQFVHWYDVGLLLHEAVSVNVVPTAGEGLLGVTVHCGTGTVGVGGAGVFGLCQVTVTPAFALVPALLLARSA